MRSVSAALLLAAALAAGAASAQVLYKWIDEQGKTQYSDRPPKAFKGEVIRIDTEIDKATLPPSPPPVPAAASPAAARAPAPAAGADIAAKRRATRARLEAKLTAARDKVAAAKTALEQGQSPEPEERQIIQQRSVGGMHGAAPRSNCRVEGSGKNKVVMCPTFVPTTEYHDKVARLEEDVRKAEEELAEAEREWRRGVD